MSNGLTQEQVKAFVLPAHGDLATVKRLLAKEPKLINCRYEAFQETAIDAASHVGNEAIARFLLENGATPTIYSAAALGDKTAVAAFLKKDPALANGVGVHGISLLYHAALSGRVDLVEMLTEAGNSQSPDQPLLAAVYKGHQEMARWLLNRGATPSATNFQDKTALEIAEEFEDWEMVSLLKSFE